MTSGCHHFARVASGNLSSPISWQKTALYISPSSRASSHAWIKYTGPVFSFLFVFNRAQIYSIGPWHNIATEVHEGLTTSGLGLMQRYSSRHYKLNTPYFMCRLSLQTLSRPAHNTSSCLGLEEGRIQAFRSPTSLLETLRVSGIQESRKSTRTPTNCHLSRILFWRVFFLGPGSVVHTWKKRTFLIITGLSQASSPVKGSWLTVCRKTPIWPVICRHSWLFLSWSIANPYNCMTWPAS